MTGYKARASIDPADSKSVVTRLTYTLKLLLANGAVHVMVTRYHSHVCTV